MRKLLVVGLVMIASVAAADPPRYSRKQPAVIPLTQSKLVKRAAPAKQTAAKPISADAVLLIKARQQPVRREQEAILEKLIKDTPDDDPDKPDLLFRLAEQYAQQVQFYRLRSVEAELRR
jgi:hypothetical protein